MKYKILFALLVCFQIVSAQFTFTKEELKKVNSLLEKGIRIDNDEHEAISWIRSKPVEVDKSGLASMTVYFGVRKEKGKIIIMPMRIVNKLNIDNWIFFDKISILSGTLKERKEGTRKRYLLTDKDTRREARGGGVVEESDIFVPYEAMEFVRLMATDPKPFHIKYSGEHKHYDKFYGVFLKEFKKKFGPVLKSYDALIKEYGHPKLLPVSK